MNKEPNLLAHYWSFLPGIVLFLVSAAVVYWFTIPTIQSLPEAQNRVKSLQSDVSELKNKQKILNSLNIAELNTLVSKADNALPTEKSFAGLLTGLELLAKEANSYLLSFDASPGLLSTQSGQLIQQQQTGVSVLPNNLQPLSASIALTSNPASLIDLTIQLVKSSRLVTLESVAFDASNNGLNTQNTAIKLNVYFQPESHATASAQDKLQVISDDEKQIIAKVDAFNRFSLNVPTKFSPRFDPFAPIGSQTVPIGSSSSSLVP